MASESKRDREGRIDEQPHWLEHVPLELMTKIGGFAGLKATSKFCTTNKKLFDDISTQRMLCAAFVSDHWNASATQQRDQLREMVERDMCDGLRAAVASEVRGDARNFTLMKARTPLADWVDSEIAAGRISDIERVAMSYDSRSIKLVTSVLTKLGVLEAGEVAHSTRFLKVVWDHATKDVVLYQANRTLLDEEALAGLLKHVVGKRLYVRLNMTCTDLKPWFSGEGGSSDVALFVVSFDDELASTSLDVFSSITRSGNIE